MATLIEAPTQVKACGNKTKIINEYVGMVNSKTSDLSVAQMESPQGWMEPGQTPEFDEYTLVLDGNLDVKTKQNDMTVKAGQAVIVKKGEWVQYSSPHEGVAKYVAICLPAFSPDAVHRDE